MGISKFHIEKVINVCLGGKKLFRKLKNLTRSLLRKLNNSKAPTPSD